ncbi:hypothetical protein CSX04_01447 [Burkholderia cepacia]|nr:hypothetical protein CSX04_01447 [Burkholderia cepacia]
MQRARRRDAAAVEHQPRRRHAARTGRRFHRLVFDRVLVRPRQQPEHLARERFRQLAGLQLLFVLRLDERLLALALERRERHLELLFRRALVLAAPLAAEVDGRAVQSQHQRRTLHRAVRRAEVFRGQRRIRELVGRRAFPQEIQVDLLRGRVGFLHQFARGRLVEFDQHVFRAHLGPPPAGQLDLKCVALARQHAARLETARFLEENVHSVLSFRLPGAASAAPLDDGNSIGTWPDQDVFPSQNARTSST